ncbi:MAG: hypothetical protein AVDCRST_MAG77-5726, partial [uncultured Chloroflexi bacterium]
CCAPTAPARGALCSTCTRPPPTWPSASGTLAAASAPSVTRRLPQKTTCAVRSPTIACASRPSPLPLQTAVTD